MTAVPHMLADQRPHHLGHVGVGGVDLIHHQQQARQRRVAHPGMTGAQHRQHGLVDGPDRHRGGHDALAATDRPRWRVPLPGVVGIQFTRHRSHHAAFQVGRVPAHQRGDALVQFGRGRPGRHREIESVDLAPVHQSQRVQHGGFRLAGSGRRLDDDQPFLGITDGGLRAHWRAGQDGKRVRATGAAGPRQRGQQVRDRLGAKIRAGDRQRGTDPVRQHHQPREQMIEVRRPAHGRRRVQRRGEPHKQASHQGPHLGQRVVIRAGLDLFGRVRLGRCDVTR